MSINSHALTDWIVSVDDHVIEPPDTWTSRLPSKYRDVGPRVVQEKGHDCWVYEDQRIVISGVVTQAGLRPDEYSPTPQNYTEMNPACYSASERIKVMNADGIMASMALPNLPRFCGQLFYNAHDRELALLCVEAYNDFILDEWVAIDPSRMIPAIIIPLWDPVRGAAEIERCAAKGARSVLFSEHPPTLGLPSIHDVDRYWDPIFETAANCGMPVSIHIGSSSKLPTTGSDSPEIIHTVLTRWLAATTFTDWLFCDALARIPKLRMTLSEGGIAWFGMALDAATYSVDHYGYYDRHQRSPGMFQHMAREHETKNWRHGDKTPLEVTREHIRGCFIGGVESYSAARTRSIIDSVGVDVFLSEADFPHMDSSYPNTLSCIDEVLAGMPAADQLKLRQDNAISWYGMDANRMRASTVAAAGTLAVTG